MNHKELEDAIRSDAAKIADENRAWRSADVSSRLIEIADDLARITREQQGGIDASMGKRSGNSGLKVEI